jgi:hypothetical protein
MTIADSLAQSADELAERLALHRELLRQATSRQEPAEPLGQCPTFDCRHRRQLRRILGEVVAVLEETRHSFKSKQLEALRKRLTTVLSEEL